MIQDEREKLLSGAMRLDTSKVIEKAKSDMRGFPLRSDFSIPSGSKTSVKHKLSSNTTGSSYDRMAVMADYDTLLNGKVSDSGFKNTIVKYWELTGQPRTRAIIKINVDKGRHPLIVLLQTAPEHRYAYSNFWIGKTLDSNSFKPLCQTFLDYMKARHGCAGVIIKEVPSKTCKVVSIDTEIINI